MSKTKAFFGWLFRVLIVAVLLLAMFIGVRAFLDSREKISYESPLTPVQTIMPEKRVIESTVSFSGYIEAEAMIPVVPFVSGTITEYSIEAGDYVEKDQVICQIDPIPYELQVAQAKAAQVVYEATLDRISALKEAGAATAQQLDEVRAQAEASEAQLKLAELQLGYASVKAPVSGTILMAPSAVGDIGSTEAPVAVIADISKLVMEISVPEKYFQLIHDRKDALTIRIQRPETSVSEEVFANTEIISISEYVDPTTKAFTIKVKLTSSIDSFRPGMYARAVISYDKSELYTIPHSAMNVDGSAYYISTDNEGNTIASYVNLDNQLSDDSHVAVPAELAAFNFVLRGQNSVLDGQRVNVVEGF